MAKIDRKGFGQVEPNHLSGIVEGKIYAQLPVDKTEMGDIIENGRFAKYDYASKEVNVSGNGQWCMIYNEQKLYDERYQGLKDFAMVKNDFVDGEITPRLIYIEIGDIFTTNTFEGVNASNTAKFTNGPTAVEKDDATHTNATQFIIKTGGTKDTNGYLTAVTTTIPQAYDGPVFETVKVYTMPDGQPGVKLQRIK